MRPTVGDSTTRWPANPPPGPLGCLPSDYQIIREIRISGKAACWPQWGLGCRLLVCGAFCGCFTARHGNGMASCCTAYVCMIATSLLGLLNLCLETSNRGHTGRPHPQNSLISFFIKTKQTYVINVHNFNTSKLQWISSVLCVFGMCLHLMNPSQIY